MNTYTYSDSILLINKIVTLAIFLFLNITTAHASNKNHYKKIVFDEGRISTTLTGTIQPNEDALYNFYGEKGQYTILNMAVYPDLNDSLDWANVGLIISPSGIYDGNKGGIVYEGCLPETGNYKLEIHHNQMASEGRTAGYQAELIVLPFSVSDELCKK